MKIFPLVSVLLICALFFVGSAQARNAVHALAGRYDQHHSSGFVGNPETYGVDDVAEIVPAGKDAAYFRVSLHFYNGHNCGIWGIANVEDGKLVYHDPTPSYSVARQCVLRLSHDGKYLKIDDEDGSCKMYCGLRGGLTDVRVPFSSRESIRYMARLKSSRQYQDAVKE
ncbi:MAG: hypothetical protein ACREPP_12200 [Rhodanobacteraceae bacterium]